MKILKTILFIGIFLIGSFLSVFSIFEMNIPLDEEDKYIMERFERSYNICQEYENNDKKLDCYLEWDIGLNETLVEWAKRRGLYIYRDPNLDNNLLRLMVFLIGGSIMIFNCIFVIATLENEE